MLNRSCKILYRIWSVGYAAAAAVMEEAPSVEAVEVEVTVAEMEANTAATKTEEGMEVRVGVAPEL